MSQWRSDPFTMVKAFGVDPDPDSDARMRLTVHQADIIKAYGIARDAHWAEGDDQE